MTVGSPGRSLPVLQAVEIHKRFGGVKALDGVSLELHPGEIHAVVGENGAGKTTLMMILSGVYQPDAGQLLVDGREIRLRDPAHAQQLGISTVFQELSLVPGVSVAENIFVSRPPVRGGRLDWHRLGELARVRLAELGVDLDPWQPVASLSRSLRQMVEIAKALSLDARVLLLDEPTASLPQSDVDRLQAVLRDLRSRGLAIVIITHRVRETLELADRVTVLRDGRVVGRFTRSETDLDTLLQAMVGRSVGIVTRGGARREFKDLPPRLHVENLSAGVLKGATFQVHPGEILGVAGLEGSGRNEIGRALFGVIPIRSGSIRLDGQPVRIRSPLDAIRCGIAYVPPDRQAEGAFPRMDLVANTTANNLDQVSRRGWVLPGRARALAQDIRDRLGVRARNLAQPFETLSGGNQQKVVLGRWLVRRPRVLVLDDPTAGVDTAAKADIHRLLVELADTGTAIVLISSELMELLAVCDRIAVLREGAIVAVLEGPDRSEEAIMRLAAGAAQPA